MPKLFIFEYSKHTAVQTSRTITCLSFQILVTHLGLPRDQLSPGESNSWLFYSILRLSTKIYLTLPTAWKEDKNPTNVTKNSTEPSVTIHCDMNQCLIYPTPASFKFSLVSGMYNFGEWGAVPHKHFGFLGARGYSKQDRDCTFSLSHISWVH